MVTKAPLTVVFKADDFGGHIWIYANGQLYYERAFLPKSEFYINLPFAASYFFSGFGFTFLRTEPIKLVSENVPLPEPERDGVNFGINKITVDSLKETPARIYTNEKVIVLNPKFFNYPIEVRLFILLHEVGHFYYKTEWKCDQYAVHHFLKMGCNPSQSFESLAGVLHTTDKNGFENITNIDRINRIYKILTEIK
jgi:hypothetical protein